MNRLAYWKAKLKTAVAEHRQRTKVYNQAAQIGRHLATMTPWGCADASRKNVLAVCPAATSVPK